MRPRYALSRIAAAVALLAASPAAAQDAVAQFYRGKQINLFVGSTPGGGYDTYARLLARRFGGYIPGNPTVVAQNMPGAGSNKLAGFMYSVAPKDGTAIGAIFSGAILQPLIGDTPTQHDPSKFIYLGNANNAVFICLARADAPAKTFRDTLGQELIIGASNEGGSTRDFPAMLNNVLGAKLRIVTGYAGSNEIMLAIERNEVAGACGVGWSSVAAQATDRHGKCLFGATSGLFTQSLEVIASPTPISATCSRTCSPPSSGEFLDSETLERFADGSRGRPIASPVPRRYARGAKARSAFRRRMSPRMSQRTRP